MKKEKTIASIFKLLQVRSSPQAILKLKSGENYKIKEVEAKNKKKSLGIVFEDEMQAIKEILINYLSIGNIRKENREKIKECNYISTQMKTEYLELIKKYEEEITNEEITNEEIYLSDGLEEFLCEKVKIKIEKFLKQEIKQEMEDMPLKENFINRILKRIKIEY